MVFWIIVAIGVVVFIVVKVVKAISEKKADKELDKEIAKYEREEAEEFAKQTGHSIKEVFFNEELAMTLITSKNLDVDLEYDSRTLLHEAARHGNVEFVKFLVSHGADIHITDKYGFTPLHHAASMAIDPDERIEIAELLISKGANINAKTNVEKTPVDIARTAGNSGNYSMVYYLESMGGVASDTWEE